MTKEITKSYILQQLQDKFKLREYIHEPFLFGETVIPTYDVGIHLSEWHVKTETVSITSAIGFTFYTIPENERWTLRGYYILFYGAGAIKCSGVYVKRPPELESIYLDLLKARDESYIVNLPQPVVLDAEGRIGILIDTYVSTQNLTLKIDVKVEEIR